MKLTFLGTGTSQGVPVIACFCNTCSSTDPKDKRLRTSALIEAEGIVLVIDAGPDFRQQMLRESVKNLDAILVTHGHKDHIGGLDDVRAFNYFQKKPMEVYARSSTQIDVKREFRYAFAEERYPGVPKIIQHTIVNKPFRIKSLEIIPVIVSHYNMMICGFRIGNIAYITDGSAISVGEKKKLTGLDVLVINALRKKKHYSHFTLNEAIEIIQELKPKRAFLTHISHQMGRHTEVENELPDCVELAWDGLNIVC